MTETEAKLAEMLHENTGIALLDSGGTNGRHWQKNQGVDLTAQPASVLAPVPPYALTGHYRPEVTHSTLHFLAECLEYDPAMNRRYQAFAAKRRKHDGELSIMQQFPEFLKDNGHAIAGSEGEGAPGVVNSYNGESLLSQIIQYVYFSCDDIDYVLMQIHGGADVRGGYTDAKAFRDRSAEMSPALYDGARATLYAEWPDTAETPPPGLEPPVDHVCWMTDDAYHWYRDSSSAHRQLQTYPVSTDPDTRGDGEHVYVDPDGSAHCPITGGKLEAGF